MRRMEAKETACWGVANIGYRKEGLFTRVAASGNLPENNLESRSNETEKTVIDNHSFTLFLLIYQ